MVLQLVFVTNYLPQCCSYIIFNAVYSILMIFAIFYMNV